jgi:hypothetical protein
MKKNKQHKRTKKEAKEIKLLATESEKIMVLILRTDKLT